MERLYACPLCNGKNLIAYLACKDYTVSHETFQLEKCSGCGFVITNPRPAAEALPRYYESDAYISHSDRSKNIIARIYKLSRKFTTEWKYRLIQKNSIQTPTSLLDYGCGTGAFLIECKKRNMSVSGIEPSPIARSQAVIRTSAPIHSDIAEVTETFDVITLWHVLEHVSALHETLTRLKSRLKQNGTMFIAVPNLQSKDAKRYNQYWAGYDVPRHLWHFTRSTMQTLLAHHKLKLINVAPMWLDSFYVSLLSEKYKRGNASASGMGSAFFQGLASNISATSTGEYSSLIYIVRK